MWMWVMKRGTIAKGYYSSSTAQPTVIGATAASQWVYAGSTSLGAVDSTQDDNVGVTLWDDTNFGHIVTITHCELRRNVG